MLRAAGGQERTIFAALFSCRFERRGQRVLWREADDAFRAGLDVVVCI